MSWEHFELGLRTLEYEERREFLTLARACRSAFHADLDQFKKEMNDEATLAGLR